MKYVVGLPYRVKSFRDSLMATCKLENVFEIDNTENNIGFSASHNLGIQKMYIIKITTFKITVKPEK